MQQFDHKKTSKNFQSLAEVTTTTLTGHCLRYLTMRSYTMTVISKTFEKMFPRKNFVGKIAEQPPKLLNHFFVYTYQFSRTSGVFFDLITNLMGSKNGTFVCETICYNKKRIVYN